MTGALHDELFIYASLIESCCCGCTQGMVGSIARNTCLLTQPCYGAIKCVLTYRSCWKPATKPRICRWLKIERCWWLFRRAKTVIQLEQMYKRPSGFSSLAWCVTILGFTFRPLSPPGQFLEMCSMYFRWGRCPARSTSSIWQGSNLSCQYSSPLLRVKYSPFMKSMVYKCLWVSRTKQTFVPK